MATHLTGRHYEIEVLPFNFKEYLHAKEMVAIEHLSKDHHNLSFLQQQLECAKKNLTEQISYTGSGSLWYESKKTNYTYDANDLNIYRQIDTFDWANFFVK